MSYSIIAVSLIAAFLLTMLFSKSFSHRGPMNGLLFFFLIIFLSTWSGQLWIHPVTQPVWGVDWGLLAFTAIAFAVLMMALASPMNRSGQSETSDAVTNDTGIAMGIFFWILLLLLVVAIAFGYYKRVTGEELTMLEFVENLMVNANLANI